MKQKKEDAEVTGDQYKKSNNSSQKDKETILGKSLINPDSLSAKQVNEFNLKHRLVLKLEAGCSAKEALTDSQQQLSELGMKGTTRWLNKIRHLYRLHGACGLLDKRMRNKSARRLFTSEVESITLTFWYGRPAAGAKAVWELTKETCDERNIPCPGYDTIRKFLKNMPEHHKLVRAGKIRTWDKQGRSVIRYENTTRGNERWQADHSDLDIWIREKVDGKWVPRNVYISAFMDAHTRSIAGFWLSKRNPDSWTILILLRFSILPKIHQNWLNQGIPRVIQPDRGADWMSHTVALSVGYLGVAYDPDPPYYPNRKGKVERWFETLDIMLLRKLPGHKLAIGKSLVSAQKHVAELLELDELRDEITKFVVEKYHQREHSETRRKPAEFWLESVDLRVPESEESLDEMLLKSDQTKTVKNTGVEFSYDGHRGHYWSPQLTDYWKQRVQIRYNPEDLNSILLYSTDKNEFICEAFLMGKEDSRFTVEDIKQERRQARQGLLERQKMYMRKIEEFDRPRLEQARQERTKALLKRQSEKNEPNAKSHKLDSAMSLINRLEQQARGEEE